MANKYFNFSSENVLRDAGLLKCPRCYLDFKFITAVLAGVFVLWLLHDVVPVFNERHVFHIGMLIALLIWQPVIEEVFFRGILQGQFLKYKWAQGTFVGISTANILVSFLFVSLHVITVPSAWSLLVIFPSIVFGYLRDVYGSVYPSIFVHIAYNLFVVIGLLLSGSAIISFSKF